MLQCDNCDNWLHGSCIGVNTANIPNQYICPFCYAILKQLHDWYVEAMLLVTRLLIRSDRGIFRYDDGNLPLLVPSLDISNNDVMLQLHEITEEHHKISKGITATKLKLDALER